MLTPKLRLRIFIKAAFWNYVLLVVLMFTAIARRIYYGLDSLCMRIAGYIES
jgi:hypothetical protein